MIDNHMFNEIMFKGTQMNYDFKRLNYLLKIAAE